MTESRNDFKFMLGFFIGGLIGALVIFFLGTKEGKKARRQLEERGQELTEDLMDKLEDLKEKGKEMMADGEELKAEVLETIAEKKEDLTVEASKKIDQALAHIEDIQARGREATAQLRKNFKNLPKKA